jgi:hypothetical protein
MFTFRILPILFSAVAILASLPCSAQLSIGSDANSLVIKSGESFSYEGLTLTPSADFVLTNTTLTRTDAKTISPTPSANYIARYFSFSNTTPAFSGTIRFSYAGATLTPLSAGSLELNIRANTTQWINISGTDVTGSYVEATGVTTRTLNTLTLGSNIAPLPVSWLEFVAVKKDNTAVLNWITATEQNSQDFLVQHNTSGNWKTLGIVKAAGNAVTPSTYSYIHTNPVKGHNHYRLIQQDRDGKKSFSEIATVWMGEGIAKISVYPNPVQNHLLNITTAEPTHITIYDATGRKVVHQKLKEGSHTLDVSGMTGGLYRLQSGNEVIPVIIP